MGLKYHVELFKFKKVWRKANPNNGTCAASMFDPQYVHIGKATYGPLNIRQANKVFHLLESIEQLAWLPKKEG